MLQIGLDYLLGDAANLVSIIVSIIVGAYLLLLWKRQENRLSTDLPLAFGLSFLFAAINPIILFSISQGLIPNTLEIFKIRAFSVWLSVFPMSIVLLDIWAYRIKHRHRQILLGESLYAISVSTFGPSEQIIMTLIIVLVLIVILALTAMFAVTWRTGRLKEVRSDIMVFSMVLMIISQLVLIPLQTQGLAFIAHIIRGVSTVIAGLALSNPWFRRQKTVRPSETLDSSVSRVKNRVASSSLLSLALLLLPVFYIFREIDIYIWNVDETVINVMPSKILSVLVLLGIFWYLRHHEFEPVLGLTTFHLRALVLIGICFAVFEYFLVNIVSTVIYTGLLDSSVAAQFTIAMDSFLIVYNFALFFINAIFEETYFRGLTYHGFKERFGINRAIVAAAIIFGFWHIAWPIQDFVKTGIFPASEAFVKVAFSGILGGLFSVWYVKFSEEKSLMGPIAAHTLINYLNEGFKIVPASIAEDGPDLSFLSPTHMVIGLVFALSIFIVCYIIFWRYRISSLMRDDSMDEPSIDKSEDPDFVSPEISPTLRRKYRSKI